jgi:hypothetical protein
MRRIPAIIFATLVLVLSGSFRAADDPKAAEKTEFPTGTWKFLVAGGPNPTPFWLIKFQKKDGKWEASVLAKAEKLPAATVEKLSVAKDLLKFNLKMATEVLGCEFRPGKDGKMAIGTAKAPRQPLMPLLLEKTTLTELSSFALNKEKLAQLPLGAPAIQVALALFRQAEARKAKPADVKSWADKAAKSAELFGPAYLRSVQLNIAEVLAVEKGFETIALQYAQRAERGLGAKESPAVQKEVLDVLAAVLKKAGKEDQSKEVEARIKKLDFRIKPKVFAGRKSKSKRVVLVEQFTNSQHKACLGSDMAFQALGKTYKPTELIRLSHHLHAPPQSDPLANPATENRVRFYGDKVDRFPLLMVNGKPGPAGGGTVTDAPEVYHEYVEAISPKLEPEAKADLQLTVTRKGDKVEVTTAVSHLSDTGEEVRLRLFLVEDQVAYKGKSGAEVHECVVRFQPGGANGVALTTKKAKKTFTINLDDIRKDLKAYLDKYAEKSPFPGKERPLDLKKLRFVAIVQNDDTGEVYQAAQVDIPEGKGKKEEKEKD